MSGFWKMCDSVENMSSKKYDANMGTTRQASAIQHAVLLLTIFSLFRIFLLLNIRHFKPETFLLVLHFQQQAEYEGQYAE